MTAPAGVMTVSHGGVLTAPHGNVVTAPHGDVVTAPQADVVTAPQAARASRSDAAEICASGLFNAAHYRAAANLHSTDPTALAQHYLDSGEAAGLTPNPLFDPAWYRRQAGPPVRCALLHYVAQGAEGTRSPHPLFDQRFYMAHPGVSLSPGATPLADYIARGWRARRDPHPLFRVDRYLTENADVRALGYDPLTHFLSNGWRERRSPCPEFDCQYYLERYPDVAASGGNPLLHFLQCGAAEGRNPSASFDTAWYVGLLPRRPGTPAENPLVHYVRTGRAAGYLPRQLAFRLDAAGMLAPDDYALWSRGLFAQLHGLAAGRPRRRVIWITDTTGEAASGPEVERIAPAGLAAWLAQNFSPGSEPPAARPSARARSQPNKGQRLPPKTHPLADGGLGPQAPAGSRGRALGLASANEPGSQPAIPPTTDVTEPASPLPAREPSAMLLVTQAGDRLHPATLDTIAAWFGAPVLLMTLDAVATDAASDDTHPDDTHPDNTHRGEANPGVLPVLLPGSNPSYLLHAETVPPFCIDAAFCHDHPPPALDFGQPGPALRDWFRDLVRAAARSGDCAIRHLPIPAAEVVLQRHRPTPPAPIPEVVRATTCVCTPIADAAADDTVSVIIPTRNAGQLLAQLVLGLVQPRLRQLHEVILVVNRPDNGFACAYHRALAQLDRVRIIDYAADYNFSDQCNLAARQATGALLLFLNDDIVPMGDQWLAHMAACMADRRVAVVGPLLLYPNEIVQHAGMYLGFNNVAGHTLRGARLPHHGTAAGLVPANCSAVTGAVMLVRAEAFGALHGFDYQLATYLQDVDFCLRVLRMGWHVVFNPHAVLFHMESISAASILGDPAVYERRGREHGRFARRWGGAVFADRYRNVHWSRQDESLNTLLAVDTETLRWVVNG